MRSRALRVLAFCAVIAVAVIALRCDQVVSSARRSAALAHPLAGIIVVLDPGHGGADSGAICRIYDAKGRPGPRLFEATLNYRIASETAAILRAEGATVVWTVTSDALLLSLPPDSDTEPPLIVPRDAHLTFNNAPVSARPNKDPADLYRRAAITLPLWQNRKKSGSGGIYYLSLHCDMFDRAEKGRGARVYRDKREALCPRFAAVLKRRLTQGGLTNSPRGDVIPRDLGVLNRWYNAIPERTLLEAATLSDPADRRAVQRPAWRWRLAHLIANAIVESEKG